MVMQYEANVHEDKDSSRLLGDPMYQPGRFCQSFLSKTGTSFAQSVFLKLSLVSEKESYLNVIYFGHDKDLQKTNPNCAI